MSKIWFVNSLFTFLILKQFLRFLGKLNLRKTFCCDESKVKIWISLISIGKTSSKFENNIFKVLNVEILSLKSIFPLICL